MEFVFVNNGARNLQVQADVSSCEECLHGETGIDLLDREDSNKFPNLGKWAFGLLDK